MARVPSGGAGGSGGDNGGDNDDEEDDEDDQCKGLRKQLREHERKLREYMADPYAHDNKGFLSWSPPERHPQIIEGRIRNLQRQIENFRRQIQEKCGK